jgi:hypothetical protein
MVHIFKTPYITLSSVESGTMGSTLVDAFVAECAQSLHCLLQCKYTHIFASPREWHELFMVYSHYVA